MSSHTWASEGPPAGRGEEMAKWHTSYPSPAVETYVCNLIDVEGQHREEEEVPRHSKCIKLIEGLPMQGRCSEY